MENENKKETEVKNETEKKEDNHNVRVDNDTLIAGLSYFIFFLPLIITPASKLGRFHANQSLILLILSLLNSILFGWILNWLFIQWPINIVLFVAWLYGIAAAFGGKFTKIPVIGNIQIIK
jgi:uncharacterized membrane protein